MSICISSAGEFGSHDLDDEHVCRDCHTLDEDALRAELRSLRQQLVPTLAEVHERRVPLAGQALARAEFDSTSYDGNDHEGVTDIEHANLITSIVEAGGLSRLGGEFTQHKVVIDVDLPVIVLPSSTPGHHHLFIDKAMDWATYLAVLEVLTAAGIVEPGYLAAAERRGHTAVRLPWVRKPATVPVPLPAAPLLDPSDCTYGAGCPIHPGAGGSHDFDPPGCTCVGLDHRHGCPQWVLTL
jgi:hypothetical protein